MTMYFNSNGSLVSLDDIAVVNALIVQRGKQIIEKLKGSAL
jgi:hypothetical protein